MQSVGSVVAEIAAPSEIPEPVGSVGPVGPEIQLEKPAALVEQLQRLPLQSSAEFLALLDQKL